MFMQECASERPYRPHPSAPRASPAPEERAARWATASRRAPWRACGDQPSGRVRACECRGKRGGPGAPTPCLGALPPLKPASRLRRRPAWRAPEGRGSPLVVVKGRNRALGRLVGPLEPSGPSGHIRSQAVKSGTKLKFGLSTGNSGRIPRLFLPELVGPSPKGLLSAQIAFQPVFGPWSRKTPFLFCFNFQKMF
jgi:hypothetical protein